MGAIPEFHFDFAAVQGQTFEDGAELLFKQMEDHYNEHIKPAPILFGGKSVPRPTGSVSTTHADPLPSTTKPVPSGDLIRVKDDYEIKNGKDLGLKEGFVLTGVTDKDVEIFDFLKNYTAGDTVVEGESGKYDLGKAK